MLLWDHAETASRERGYEFLVSLALGAIFVNFIEPGIRQRLSLGAHPPPAADDAAPELLRIRLGSVLLGAFMGLIFELIHSAISHDPNRFFRANMLLLTQSGVVTYAWVRGAHARPSRAAWYGVAGGALGGLISGILGEMGIFAMAPDAWRVLSPLVALAEASRRTMANVAVWALYGLIGGYVIDRLPFRRSVGPACAPALAIVIVFPLMLAIDVLAGEGFGAPSRIALSFARTFAAGAGWTFGLLLCPGAGEELTVPGRRPLRVGLGWAALVVLAYLVLSGDVLYRWFPNTEQLVEDRFSSAASVASWSGSCHLTHEDRALVVTNPRGQCDLVFSPEPPTPSAEPSRDLAVPGGSCPSRPDDAPFFGTPLVIDVTLSTELVEGQAVGVTYWDHVEGRSYGLWIKPHAMQLVTATEGPDTDGTSGEPVVLSSSGFSPRSHAPNSVQLEVLQELVRAQVNGVPVMSSVRTGERCLHGNITVSLSGVKRVELLAVSVSRWLGSLRPF